MGISPLRDIIRPATTCSPTKLFLLEYAPPLRLSVKSMDYTPRCLRGLAHLFCVWLIYVCGFVPIAYAKAQTRTPTGVTATFYNHDFGQNFPHVFVTLKGHNTKGQTVDINYGFTASDLSPAILWGAVKGEIRVQPPAYIARSTPRFSVQLTDESLGRIMTITQKWNERAQPNYHLDTQNCVHFIEEILTALDFKTNPKSKNFKRPRAYLLEVLDLNPHRIQLHTDRN